MMSSDHIRSLILEEMRIMDDWISIAAAIESLDKSSFYVEREDVKQLLEFISRDDSFKLMNASSGFKVVGKPLPIDCIVDAIFATDNPADRAARMMELFIGTDDSLPR